MVQSIELVGDVRVQPKILTAVVAVYIHLDDRE
jgi:hypothetical protein